MFAPESVSSPPDKTTDPAVVLDPEITPAKVPFAFVRVSELEPKRTVALELAPLRDTKFALLLTKLVRPLISKTPLLDSELLTSDPPPLKAKVE